RAELAAIGADYEQKVLALDDLRRKGDLPFQFLPNLRFPLAWPVWQEAKFSTENGMLLPPYLPAGKKDGGLALHLPPHGDVEAAPKLADPADKDTLARIDGFALPRNYPAEWTRLVALILDKAHMNLAAGDADAAKRIASVHEQLNRLLEKETRSS